MKISFFNYSPGPYEVGQRLSKIKVVAALIIATILVVLLVLVPLTMIANFLEKKTIDKEVDVARGVFRTSLTHWQEEVGGLAQLGIFNGYLLKQDKFGALNSLNELHLQKDIEFLAVLDEDGVAFARTNNSLFSHNYIFDTTQFGASVYEKKIFSSIDEGPRSPLSLSAGAMLSDADIPIGAIVIGQIINDEYARKIQKEHLAKGSQIAIYSDKSGIVANSFDNQLIDETLQSNFDSLHITSNYDNVKFTSGYVSVDGVDYSIRIVPFDSMSSSDGGFILFSRHSPLFSLIKDLLLSVLCIIIFGILLTHLLDGATLIYLYNIIRGKSRFLPLLLVALLYLVCFGLIYKFDDIKSLSLKKPLNPIYNSIVRLVPEGGILISSGEQNISIEIVTGGEQINAVHAEILYDPAKVRIVEIRTAFSFCDKGFIIEKLIDNERGRASIQCGIVGGYEKQVANVADLVLQPMSSEGFSLQFGGATQVLAHDGLGTNVLRESVGGQYSIAKYENRNSSNQTILFPLTHQNSERWYRSREIKYKWKGGEDNSYSYTLDQLPNTIPSASSTTRDTQATLYVVDNGIYYFHIQTYGEHGSVVGEVIHHKIKIDITPPELPVLVASSMQAKVGDVVRIEFSSKDDDSGLQNGYYYTSFDSGILLPVQSPLFVVFPDTGPYNVRVGAYDNAGNFSENSIKIQVEDGSLLFSKFLDRDFYLQFMR